MSNFPHRIRRLYWLVNTDSLAEAFSIRQCLHEQWQNLLLSACEKVFDQTVNDERIIHISKLELFIKVTSEQEIMQVLPELIQQKIKEQLESINWQAIPTNLSSIIWQETTAEQSQFATLLYYLRTGSLPWQSAYAETSTIASKLKETYRQQQTQLINYLSNQPETASFYFRLLQLLPEVEYLVIANTLLDKFSSELRATISEFIRLVITISNKFLSHYNQERILAATLAECSSQSEQYLRANFENFITNIIDETRSNYRIFLRDIPDTFASLSDPRSEENESNILDISTVDATINQLEILSNYLQTEAIVQESADIVNSQITANLSKVFDSIVSHSSLSTVEQDLARNHNLEIPNQVIAVTEDQFAFSVNYAGLVLLYPFITPFFEATGVKETNSKTIIDSQIVRAAVLLHFLATGKEEIYEYELGLIKILLGLEPETPLLVSSGLLQNGDQEEAETVLQSTINYWTVLKNTSINGLRSSFLQRSGLVRRTENGWQLQVEPQSFDMLIQYLPWTISIIKLSWMKQPIYTEWQTF